MREISQLIVRMAQENPGWGYTRIQGALGNLNHVVGRATISNVLKRNGIEPAPERSKRTTWSTFLRAPWKVLAASDFFTVEVWTPKGLLTHYVLFVISVAERVVHIAGITTRVGRKNSRCANVISIPCRLGGSQPERVLVMESAQLSFLNIGSA